MNSARHMTTTQNWTTRARLFRPEKYELIPAARNSFGEATAAGAWATWAGRVVAGADGGSVSPGGVAGGAVATKPTTRASSRSGPTPEAERGRGDLVVLVLMVNL